jgi:hypothetical protein
LIRALIRATTARISQCVFCQGLSLPFVLSSSVPTIPRFFGCGTSLIFAAKGVKKVAPCRREAGKCRLWRRSNHGKRRPGVVERIVAVRLEGFTSDCGSAGGIRLHFLPLSSLPLSHSRSPPLHCHTFFSTILSFPFFGTQWLSSKRTSPCQCVEHPVWRNNHAMDIPRRFSVCINVRLNDIWEHKYH